MIATISVIAAAFVVCGLIWAVVTFLDARDAKKYRKKEPKMTMSRSTATTVKLDLERSPTLEELEKFVEEARLAGVSPRAKVNVNTFGRYGYTAVHFSVRQSLDLE